jgi:hypothetical protein
LAKQLPEMEVLEGLAAVALLPALLARPWLAEAGVAAAIFPEPILLLAEAVEEVPVGLPAQMAPPERQTLVVAVAVLAATTKTAMAEMVVLA